MLQICIPEVHFFEKRNILFIYLIVASKVRNRDELNEDIV